MLVPKTSDNCQLRTIRTCLNLLPHFYDAVYIIVRTVHAAGAKPPPYGIPWRVCEPRITYTPKSLIFTELPIEQAQTSKFALPKNPIFAKMKLSSLARRFIANGVSPNYIPNKA